MKPLVLAAALLASATGPAIGQVGPDQTIGQKFHVDAAALKKPYDTGVAVRNSPLIIPREGRVPILPPGFTATLYADKLDHPRQLAFLPNGDALVSMQEGGYIMLMRDADGDGRAEWLERHAAGFNGPYGIAAVFD